MGKEVPPLANDTPSEDVLTIKDVISQAKVVKKPRDEDLAKTTITKEDPPPPEEKVVGFYFPCFVFPTLYL